MSKIKKTFNVQDLVEQINRRNRKSTCVPEVRRGWNCVLEDILMETNQYRGFGYLKQEEVPEGHRCGMIPADDIRNTTHEFPDETRRFYYTCEKGKSNAKNTQPNA